MHHAAVLLQTAVAKAAQSHPGRVQLPTLLHEPTKLMEHLQYWGVQACTSGSTLSAGSGSACPRIWALTWKQPHQTGAKGVLLGKQSSPVSVTSS